MISSAVFSVSLTAVEQQSGACRRPFGFHLVVAICRDGVILFADRSPSAGPLPFVPEDDFSDSSIGNARVYSPGNALFLLGNLDWAARVGEHYRKNRQARLPAARLH